MNREDAAILALRILAIYAWLQGLGYLASGVMGPLLAMVMSMGGAAFSPGILVVLGPAAAYLVIGLGLFLGSRHLVNWMLPPRSGEAPEAPDPADPPANPLVFASIAFAAVGLFIGLEALPSLLHWGLHLVSTPDAGGSTFLGESPSMLGSGLQFALAVLLFFKSRLFAQKWWRKQQPAVSRTE